MRSVKPMTWRHNTEKIRLDKAVSSQAQTLSRAEVKSLIESGHVRVNGETKKPSHTLQEGDEVTLTIPSVPERPLEHVPMNLDIIYEDESLIVVNKPSGIITHPAQTTDEATLLHGLLDKLDPAAFSKPERAGVVHRLDRHTSGLLVFARNEDTLASLQGALANREVKRQYLALVHGPFTHAKGTVDAPIGRHPVKRHLMSVVAEGKASVTHFSIYKRFEAHTLLECSLQSGRTHQIRVHMQYIDHPVVGDEMYGRKSDANPFGQYLHAYRLEFTHPLSNAPMTFEAPLPEAFAEKLRMLGDAHA